MKKENHFQRASADFWYRKLTLKIEKCLILMSRCSHILSNFEKSPGFHECGPKGLSNFGCLRYKCFHLNYYNFGIIIPQPRSKKNIIEHTKSAQRDNDALHFLVVSLTMSVISWGPLCTGVDFEKKILINFVISTNITRSTSHICSRLADCPTLTAGNTFGTLRVIDYA